MLMFWHTMNMTVLVVINFIGTVKMGYFHVFLAVSLI